MTEIERPTKMASTLKSDEEKSNIMSAAEIGLIMWT